MQMETQQTFQARLKPAEETARSMTAGTKDERDNMAQLIHALAVALDKVAAAQISQAERVAHGAEAVIDALHRDPGNSSAVGSAEQGLMRDAEVLGESNGRISELSRNIATLTNRICE